VTLDLSRHSAGRARTGTTPASRVRQRGQSLVEFALILPLLLLLIVIALDFGRIYLGYINVQNMARIAANEAANNPLAWSVTPDTGVQTRYRNKVLEDASATNCILPVTAGGDPIVADPVFTDRTGDGISVGLGDEVTVQLTCSFSVATPIIASILGDQIPVTAESDFPVKSGMTAVAPSGTGGGGGGATAAPTSAFIANSSVTAAAGSPGTLYTVGPTVIVDFRDSSGGAPSGWYWDFGDGATSTSRDVAHQFNCGVPDAFGYCTYLVEMRASNVIGIGAPAYMTVLVLGSTAANFTADVQSIDRTQSVTFTDASTPGGTNFAWTFGDGTPVVSGPASSVTHTYATAGTFNVSLTVTYPAPASTASVTKVGFITVNPGYCPVPSLKNVEFANATAKWQGNPYNFTGTVKRATGAPEGDFTIKAQSIASSGNAMALCNSDIYVSAP
jgi:PKD repeat protein